MARPTDANPLSPEERQSRKQRALDEILSDAASFAELPEEHRDRLAHYAGQLALAEIPMVCCWAPDTPREIVEAYMRVEQRIGAAEGFNSMALQVVDRWTRTATNGTGLWSQGLPVTLTWSIVPDGSPVAASNAGESNAPSSLRARMAAIYGGSATGNPMAQPWFPVFQAVFDNLAATSGLRFVYEPADDGAALTGSSSSGLGALGVRGDIRLGGHSIDGNGGILAYSYFPNSGDVVFDTNDNYYNTISNDSIRLRNILEHEIGHSLGLAHVCPINATKLMEPSLSLGFRGSQFDDIYSHQRNYGDPFEVHGSVRDNDTAANATPLTLSTGTTASWQWLSIDGSSDTDFFSFTGNTGQQVTVRIIPSDPIEPDNPDVDTYLEGGQSGGTCSGGIPFDPTTQQDLSLDLLSGDGSTVIAAAPVQPAGVTEEIVSFQLPADGIRYIRVRGGTTDRAQLYRMEVLRVDAAPLPQLTIAATRLDAESNSGGNGVPDPGETIRLGITLTNQGDAPASNLIAALSAPAGASLFVAAGDYGTLAPGASAERLFTFALAGSPGEVANLQLAVNGTAYSVELPLALTLGTSGNVSAIAADFDSSTSFPTGWTQSVSGSGSPWVVSSAQSSSPPNAIFSPGVTVSGESQLVSPAATVGPNGGTLEFNHHYDLHYLFDGAVLEASRNGGAWFDLPTSGGVVVNGGYSGTISPDTGTSLVLKGSWTGNSGGVVAAAVELPAAWSGDSIRFRWRLVHDDGEAGSGWLIDNVNFALEAPVSDPFHPRVSLTASLSALAENDPGDPAVLTLSTPLPLARDLLVIPILSGTATAADLTAPVSFLLPAGQTSVQVAVSALADGLIEGPETLLISLPSDSPDFEATSPAAVTLNIADHSGQAASVILSNLDVTYDGSPKSATVTTVPAGLPVTVSYNGSAQAPSDVGSYEVIVTISDPAYQGSAGGTLVVGSAYAAWIATFADPGDPAALASGDLDNDGWDNAAEYTFGTLPDDPSSLPRLQSLLTPGSLQLMVPPPPPGVVIHAETSVGLGFWTADGVTAIPGGFEVPRDTSKRFLRVVYEVVN